MSLAIGDVAPDLKLTDTEGKPFDLASVKGKKVYLCFLRYGACMMCALRVAEAKKRAKALKDQGLVMMLVMNSTAKEIQPYGAGKLADADLQILCDREGTAYQAYKTKKSCMASPLGCAMCIHTCGDCRMPQAACGCCNSLAFGKGTCGPCCGFMNCSTQHMDSSRAQQMPADFLIDENGKLVDVLYGSSIGKHMPWSKIEAFASGKDLNAPQQQQM
ncbi:unnamed protein product [Amoebophrya sp. A120]|nr:unnamed protein product [Amoebophrya sp. A120]|eukprot:GSA120T00005100001.1